MCGSANGNEPKKSGNRRVTLADDPRPRHLRARLTGTERHFIVAPPEAPGVMASHLFFDLDGTVTDPRDGIVRCLAHALAALGRTVPPADVLERFIGPPLAPSFETLLGTADENVIREAIASYRERFSHTGIFENRVYPEIPSALSALTARGFSLYLVTSKADVFARRILDYFDLSRHFTRVYAPDLDDVRIVKATLLRRALASEGVAASAAAMIGDRRDDIEAARANGVRSIGVTWGFGTREELARAGANDIVSSAPELLALVSDV